MKRKFVLSLLAGTLCGAAAGCAQNQALLPQDESGRSVVVDQRVPLEQARRLEQDGKVAEAHEMYRRMLRANPRDPQLLHRMGVVCARLERGAEATEYLMQALRLEPNNAHVLTDLGYSLYLQNDLGAAEVALTQARIEDPSNRRAVNNLAMVMLTQGRETESLAILQDALGETAALTTLAQIQAEARPMPARPSRVNTKHIVTLERDVDPDQGRLLQTADEFVMSAPASRYEQSLSAATAEPKGLEAEPEFVDDTPFEAVVLEPVPASIEAADAGPAPLPAESDTAWYDDITAAEEAAPVQELPAEELPTEEAPTFVDEIEIEPTDGDQLPLIVPGVKKP